MARRTVLAVRGLAGGDLRRGERGGDQGLRLKARRELHGERRTRDTDRDGKPEGCRSMLCTHVDLSLFSRHDTTSATGQSRPPAWRPYRRGGAAMIPDWSSHPG